MRRSKLEMYVDILKLLAHQGPLKLTHLMHKANLCCKVLKEYLDFLIEHGLVEERISKREIKLYAITQCGVKVVKQFRELNNVLLIGEETENEVRNQKHYLF